MKAKRRIRLTYANAVSSLALFAALGGSSYAAVTITGAQVRDGSLTGRDVRNGTLTGGDVRDRSLLARDFKAGQLPAGPQGPKGDAGAPGPKGDTGPKGDPGAPATDLWVMVDSDGNITAASGVTTAGPVKEGPGSGRYLVPFARDISHCARVATIGGARVGEGEKAGFIKTSLRTATSVDVQTIDDGGIAFEDHGFSLAVLC